MNTLITLVKREYWENRGSFFKSAAVFGGFILFAAILYLILFSQHHHYLTLTSDTGNSTDPLKYVTPMIFFSISMPFMIVLWLIVFYYFLNCLYDDRKDRSILFWQSMPIAEWETIFSKMLAGIVIAPICTWICIVVTEFFILIITTIAFAISGIHGIGALWAPMSLISAWLHILSVLFVQALWLFPLFGWCMLCSAYAKRSPFLTAIIPYILILIVETVFVHHGVTGRYVISRFTNASKMWFQLFDTINLSPHPDLIAHNLYTANFGFGFTSLYWSLAIGVIFMAIAGYLRYICFRNDD